MAAPKIDYTNRDFDTIVEALKVHLQNKFPNTWRSFYEADLGTAWLQLVAYVFDVLSFYLDVQANETYLDTARDRLSVINICKLIGYKLAMPRASSVTVTATIAEGPQANDVIVEKGISIQSRGGVPFRTLSQQTIPALASSGELTFYQGEQQIDNFTSDGTVFQRILLTKTEVIHNSITVTVDGDVWTELNSLVYATNTSQVFEVSVDEEDNASITFGDGTSGMTPPNGVPIIVTYRVGGGVQGNIDLDEIDTDISGRLDIAGPPTYVTLELANDVERGSGGVDRETTAEAKFWAPQWAQTNGRAVTERDFDVLANAFVSGAGESVYRAKAMLHQEIPEYNLVDIYVWSQGAGGEVVAPSGTLKDALETYFNNNGEGAIRVICTDVDVLDGNIVYIDIDLTATLESQYSTVAAVASIGVNLDALFSGVENQPGTSVRISRAYDAIQDSSGVEHAVINQITASYADSETGAGTGAANYVRTLVLEPGLPIVPGSVEITTTTPVLAVTDDRDGNLIGDVDPLGVNTVNYVTGVVNVTFNQVIPGGTITYAFRRIIDFARTGEVIETGNGIDTNFQGAIDYPPIVPFTAGQKGIQITDSSQVLADNGAGVFAGDGTGTIDYDTGAYNITFDAAPGNGVSIYASYAQMLRTPSEDVPINKTQLAVKSVWTVATN